LFPRYKEAWSSGILREVVEKAALFYGSLLLRCPWYYVVAVMMMYIHSQVKTEKK